MGGYHGIVLQNIETVIEPKYKKFVQIIVSEPRKRLKFGGQKPFQKAIL